MNFSLRLYSALFINALSSLLSLSVLGFCALYLYIQFNLPDVDSLAKVQLQVPMRVYSQDHKLIAEFGEKHRIPVPYQELPPLLIKAVVATEDQRFFEHEGIDLPSLMRAAITLVTSGKKSQGGSTITMQVARNYFLTRKKTYKRKFDEILLAVQIDRTFSKEKILELYFNKIFFGNRAYGVAAAAQVYYGKKLNELTLPEIAMLAGLPKAPSTLNPLTNPVAALKRRNHVLQRMLEERYIDNVAYQAAIQVPITARYHEPRVQVKAPYVAEMVRQTMLEKYGADVYDLGYQVTTTIRSDLQLAANTAVTDAILGYDMRHGYRGYEKNLGGNYATHRAEWQTALAKLPNVNELPAAAIISITAHSATAVLADGKTITIPWDGLKWARYRIGGRYLHRAPNSANEIVGVGDVVRLYQNKNGWRLAQMPEVEGAFVALNPMDGAILALDGGFNYQRSMFNRATQSQRQPGSNIKPFLYSAALDHDMTLATIINDAPVVIDDPSLQHLWRPQNDSHKFQGPTRLRMGLVKSQNLVSIRILDLIGIPYVRDYLTKFGFDKAQIPKTLSLALGTNTVNPLQLATGYAVFANGGYKVTPYLIASIEDLDQKTVFTASPNTVSDFAEHDAHNTLPAPQVISPETAFLITSAMQDVIKRGTAHGAAVLNRADLAGKTGTTNDKRDAWFSGFNQHIVGVAWMGFDTPRKLYEYGAQAALPMWVDFMRAALANMPEHAFTPPANIVSVRINPLTGALANANEPDAITEYFTKASAPHIADSQVATASADADLQNGDLPPPSSSDEPVASTNAGDDNSTIAANPAEPPATESTPSADNTAADPDQNAADDNDNMQTPADDGNDEELF